MDMMTVPKRIVDLLTQIQKDGVIQRASELQEVYRLIAAHSAGAQEPVALTYSERKLLARINNDNKSYVTWDDRQNVLKLVYRLCALYAQPQPMTQTDAARDLSNLLARIHRDGGHYEAEHGTDKAVADADDKVAPLNAMMDAARDAKRYQAIRSQVLPFNAYASGNPNWRFPRYGPRGATFDEAIDAEIERIDRNKEQS